MRRLVQNIPSASSSFIRKHLALRGSFNPDQLQYGHVMRNLNMLLEENKVEKTILSWFRNHTHLRSEGEIDERCHGQSRITLFTSSNCYDLIFKNIIRLLSILTT
jgi:hypothetical protein